MARPESGQGLLDGHEESAEKGGMLYTEDHMNTLGITSIRISSRNYPLKFQV